MFHGTNGIIKDIAVTTDICLTPDKHIAEDYGRNIYKIKLDRNALLACEDAIRETYEALHGRTEDYIFEMADCPATRANLAADGFAGCEYDDLSPNNNREHETVRVWDASVISLA